MNIIYFSIILTRVSSIILKIRFCFPAKERTTNSIFRNLKYSHVRGSQTLVIFFLDTPYTIRVTINHTHTVYYGKRLQKPFSKIDEKESGGKKKKKK